MHEVGSVNCALGVEWGVGMGVLSCPSYSLV